MKMFLFLMLSALFLLNAYAPLLQVGAGMIGEGLGNHLEEQQQQAKKEEKKKKEAAEKQSNQDDKYLKIYQENQKRNQQRTILY